MGAIRRTHASQRPPAATRPLAAPAATTAGASGATGAGAAAEGRRALDAGADSRQARAERLGHRLADVAANRGESGAEGSSELRAAVPGVPGSASAEPRLSPEGSLRPAAIARGGMTEHPRPLPHLAALERGFATRLDWVRSYQGPAARRAAAALDANAYAHRGAVVLGERADLATVAEETAHALQQTMLPGAPGHPRPLDPSHPAEAEAGRAAAAVAVGRPAGGLSAALGAHSVARNGKRKKKKAAERAQRGVNLGREAKVAESMGFGVNVNPHGTRGTGRGGAEAHQNRSGRAVRSAVTRARQSAESRGGGQAFHAAGGRVAGRKKPGSGRKNKRK